MNVNYEAIRLANIEEYGKGTRHLAYLSDLYSTRTHFIFELLQNTEDAIARAGQQNQQGFAEFRLYPDRLELRHNGKPFDEKDIRGICGIGEGTKAGDYGQIGKFGVGFKAVYSYTLAPQVHSGQEHFRIQRFVEPYHIDGDAGHTELSDNNETLIVLPFDSEELIGFRDRVPPEVAVKEIGKALKGLHPRSMLFLRHIREVRWFLPDGESGSVRRRSRSLSDNTTTRVVNLFFGNQRERWLVFAQETQIEDFRQQKAKIEVAFQMEGRCVVQAQDTELVVFFPTKVRTDLGFLIQAPFKTKVTRESLDEDCVGNKGLLLAAAKLASEGLDFLRDIGRMAPQSYAALPIVATDFQTESFCRPVFDEIKCAIKTRNLLPSHTEADDEPSFISGSQAVATSDPDLRELLTNDELKEALGGDTDWRWLAEDMSLEGEGALAIYLRDEIEVQELTVDDFVSWLETKDVDWWKALDEECLLSAYRYLHSQSSEHKRLRKLPLVRLESGEHISPDEQAVFFPADNIHEKKELAPFLSQLPIIRLSLLAGDDDDQLIAGFLRKVGVSKLQADAFIRRVLMPLYSKGSGITVGENQSHVRYLFHVFQRHKSDEKKAWLNDLNALNWLLCKNTSEPEKYFLGKPGELYLSQAYTGTEFTDVFFEPSSKTQFVDEGYPINDEIWIQFLCELGCATLPRRSRDRQQIDGLGIALARLNTMSVIGDRIRLVNSIFSVLGEHLPKQDWEREPWFQVQEAILGPRGGYHGSRSVDASFWTTLKQTYWLPDTSENLRRPNALYLDTDQNRHLLDDSVFYLHKNACLDGETAKWLATKLGVRFIPNKDAVLTRLKKLRNSDSTVTDVAALYQFLSRVGADVAIDFEDSELIYCPENDQKWRPPSKVFWNDESPAFGATRCYLKSHYPTLQEFFLKVGVASNASPADYADALVEIAKSEAVEAASRDRIHRIYKRLSPRFDEGGDWLEEVTWKNCWGHLMVGRFWLGRKGDDFGFYPLSELVVVDNEHLEILFHGEVAFWPFKELNEFAKAHLEIETCSKAEQVFDVECKGQPHKALSEHLANVWTSIGDFLQSDKWKSDVHDGRDFIDSPPMIRTAGKIGVIYALKNVEAKEPDGKAAYFDSVENAVWLVPNDVIEGDESYEALGEALQEHFGPEPLREFIYDLFRKGIEKSEVKWRKRGLMSRRTDSEETQPTELASINSREKLKVAGASTAPAGEMGGDAGQTEEAIKSSSALASPATHINSPPDDNQGVEAAPFSDKLKDALNKPGKATASPQVPEISPVSNPERRREQTDKEIAAAREKEPHQSERQKTLPRTVWESKNPDVRSKLKQWYAGKCQICSETFQKRDGDNYFEAFYLVSRTEKGAAWLDRVGNVLCLCADCSAKFQFGPIESPADIQKKIADLKLVNEGGTQPHTVSIRLCGKDVAINFEERHLIDLQLMLKSDRFAIASGGETKSSHKANSSKHDLVQCPHCPSKVRNDRLKKHISSVHGKSQSSPSKMSETLLEAATRRCKAGCGRSAMQGADYCHRCM